MKRLQRACTLYSPDPLVGVIDGFRWAIAGSAEPLDGLGLAVSATMTAFFLWLGVWYFRKMECMYADII